MLQVYAKIKLNPCRTKDMCVFSANGRNQAVRIPRDFELDGNKAVMRKEGNRLIIEPVGEKNRLLELLKTLEPVEEDFPEMEDPPIADE